ncbi:MAG: hypothetical protein ACRELA_10975, partial [Candidatus Rokuibacteriota bacterium]
DALGAALGRLAAANSTPGSVDAANRTLRALSRTLIPLAYTTGDRFQHDLALPVAPLAGLQPARELGTLDPDSDAFKFTATALVRERNRVVHALEEAAEVIDDLMRSPEGGLDGPLRHPP